MSSITHLDRLHQTVEWLNEERSLDIVSSEEIRHAVYALIIGADQVRGGQLHVIVCADDAEAGLVKGELLTMLQGAEVTFGVRSGNRMMMLAHGTEVVFAPAHINDPSLRSATAVYGLIPDWDRASIWKMYDGMQFRAYTDRK